MDWMTLFARSTSVTPGSCTSNWSSLAPCRAMSGSATPSSFTRRSIVCCACVTAARARSIATFGFITNVWVPSAPPSRLKRRLDDRGGLAEQRVLRRRHPGHLELRRAQHLDREAGDAGLLGVLAHALGAGLGLQLQRVVGVDAEHEVDAALEVEAQPDLLAPAG